MVRNMKYLKILLISVFLVAAVPSCGLLGSKDASGLVSGTAALAFDGAAVALQVLDQKETEYLDSLAEPTSKDIADAEEQVARLQRAREALVIARSYLSGESQGNLKAVVASAVKELLLVADELVADGVAIPQAVLDGLEQAAVYSGVK